MCAEKLTAKGDFANTVNVIDTISCTSKKHYGVISLLVTNDETRCGHPGGPARKFPIYDDGTKA